MKREHSLTPCTKLNSKMVERPKYKILYHKTPERDQRSVSQSKRNKSKNKQMEPN